MATYLRGTMGRTRVLQTIFTANTNPFKAGVASATAQTTGFRKALNAVNATAVAAFKVAGVAAVGFAGYGVKAFMDFDKAMTESTSIMGTLSDTMRNDLSNAAKEVGRTTTFSATEAAESIYYLSSSGLEANQVLGAMPKVAQFAMAGQFDLKEATEQLTDAQTALGLESDNTEEHLRNMTRVSDVLAEATKMANASTSEFAYALTNEAASSLKVHNKDVEEGVAVLGYFADEGLKGQAAGKALSIVLRDVARAADNNREEFAAMNIEVFDQEGNLKNLADIADEFTDALGGMSDEQRTAAMESMGLTRQVRAQILRMMDGGDKIREYEQRLRSAGGATQEVAENQIQNLSDQFSLLRSRINVAAIELGEALAPIITNTVIPALISIIEYIENDLGPTFARLASAIGRYVIAPFFEATKFIFQFDAAMKALSLTITAFVSYGGLVVLSRTLLRVGGAFGTLAERAGWLAFIFRYRLGVAVMWVGRTLGISLLAAKGVVGAAIAAIIAVIVLLVIHWETLRDVTIAAWDAIYAALEPIVGSIVGWVQSIINWYTDLDSSTRAVVTAFLMLSNPVGLVVGMVAGLILFIQLLIDKWDDLLDMMGDVWDTIVEFTDDLFSSLYDIIVDVGEEVVSLVMELWELEATQSVVEGLTDAFVDLSKGIVDVSVSLAELTWDLTVGLWDLTWELGKFVYRIFDFVVGPLIRRLWDETVRIINLIIDLFSPNSGLGQALAGIIQITMAILRPIVDITIKLIVGLIVGTIEILKVLWNTTVAIAGWALSIIGKMFGFFSDLIVETLLAPIIGMREFLGWVVALSNGIRDLLDPVVGWLQDTFGPTFTWLWEVVEETTGFIVDLLETSWNWLVDNVFEPTGSVITGLGDTFRGLWNAVEESWESIVDASVSAWNWLYEDVLRPMWDFIAEPLIDAWNSFADASADAWETIESAAIEAWDWTYENVLRPMWDFVGDTLVAAWDGLGDAVQETWSIIESTAIATWNWLYENVLRPMWDFVGDTLVGAWHTLRDAVRETWRVIEETAGRVWTWLYEQVLRPMWDFIENTLILTWNTLRDTVVGAWMRIEEVSGRIWRWLRDNVFSPIASWIDDTLRPAWDGLWESVSGAWDEIWEAAEEAWDFLEDEVFDPMHKWLTEDLPDAWEEFRESVTEEWEEVQKGFDEGFDTTKQQEDIDEIESDWNDFLDRWNRIWEGLFEDPKLPDWKIQGIASAGSFVAGFDSGMPDWKLKGIGQAGRFVSGWLDELGEGFGEIGEGITAFLEMDPGAWTNNPMIEGARIFSRTFISIMGGTWDRFYRNFVEPVKDFFAEFSLGDWFDEQKDKIERFWEWLSNASWGEIIGKIFGLLLQHVKDFAWELFMNLTWPLRMLWKGFVWLYDWLAEFDWAFIFEQIKEQLYSRFVEPWVEGWERIRGAAEEAWDFLYDFVFEPMSNVINGDLSISWGNLGLRIFRVWEHIKNTGALAKDFLDNNVFNPIKDGLRNLGFEWDDNENTVTNVWNNIQNLSGLAKDFLIDRVFQPLMDFISGDFTFELFGMELSFGGVWDGIKNTSERAFNFLKDHVFDPIGGLVEDLIGVWEDADLSLSGIWEGIKSTASRIWRRIVDAIKRPVNDAIGFINGLGRGINTVVNILPGVSVEIPEVPTLARGGQVPVDPNAVGPFMTNGPRAIVGEGNPRYPEYVVPTDPKYRGRARGLTARLIRDIGLQTGGTIPSAEAFAGAAGEGLAETMPGGMSLSPGDLFDSVKDIAGDIVGFVTKGAAKAVWGAIKKIITPMLDAIDTPFVKKMAQGALNVVDDWIDKEDAKLPDEMPMFTGPVGAGVEQWRPLAMKALMDHPQGDPRWIDSLLRRMNQESGGNPNAFNAWDSNARAGIPTQGLMQHIPSAFQQRLPPHLKGASIFDPYASIYAAITYTVQTYGSGPAGWDQSGGYKSGAWRINRDQIARLHEGETVLPSRDADAFRNAASDALLNNRSAGVHIENITINVDGAATPADARRIGQNAGKAFKKEIERRRYYTEARITK